MENDTLKTIHNVIYITLNFLVNVEKLLLVPGFAVGLLPKSISA